MTGRRYFYTDPLAAAWRAKHFGMKIIGADNEPIWLHQDLAYFEYINGGKREQEKPPIECRSFYIHPDSVQLLEPRGSDLTEAGIWRALDKTIAPADNRIIQRNGKPFFWPESEAV